MKPIRVRLKRAVDEKVKGSEYGYESEAVADRELGEGSYTILSYVDTSEYVAPEPKAEATTETTDEPKAKKG